MDAHEDSLQARKRTKLVHELDSQQLARELDCPLDYVRTLLTALEQMFSELATASREKGYAETVLSAHKLHASRATLDRSLKRFAP